MEGLRSAGPANAPIIADAQFALLEEELGKGPAAHGFEDERWTLVRVQSVIRRRLRPSRQCWGGPPRRARPRHPGRHHPAKGVGWQPARLGRRGGVQTCQLTGAGREALPPYRRC
jgi:hypothetical protein